MNRLPAPPPAIRRGCACEVVYQRNSRTLPIHLHLRRLDRPRPARQRGSLGAGGNDRSRRIPRDVGRPCSRLVRSTTMQTTSIRRGRRSLERVRRDRGPHLLRRLVDRGRATRRDDGWTRPAATAAGLSSPETRHWTTPMPAPCRRPRHPLLAPPPLPRANRPRRTLLNGRLSPARTEFCGLVSSRRRASQRFAAPPQAGGRLGPCAPSAGLATE